MAYRAGALIAGALLPMLLSACGGVGALDAEPKHAQNLSGHWVLDRAASENPQPLLEKLRPRPRSPSEIQSEDGLPPVDDRGQAGPPAGGRGRRGQQNPQQMYSNNDAFERASVLRMLRADLARDPLLTVRQSPEQFSLDYGSEVRSFTPGTRSVVSAAWGVADQSAGWKGRDFVIEIRPQSGVPTTEKYSLADDGKHLVEQLTMGGHGYPSVELKRVYDRSEDLNGRGLPTTD